MDKLGTMVNYLKCKLAWIKSTDLAKELIKYNQTGMTLNQVAQIQAGLQYKPQVQRVPGKWQTPTLMMLSMQWIRSV